MATIKNKTIIGWQEWCSFPDLNIPLIKAKIDTGAKTTALHADHLQVFQKDGVDHIRFTLHPIQKNRGIIRVCEAPIVDHRTITSSNGEKEKRYVIETLFRLGEIEYTSQVTLTTRYGMKFRMLLGKNALKEGKLIIDPAKSFVLGKHKNAKDLYL